MKLLCILLVVAVAQASVVRVRAPEDIPAPNLKRLTALDPPGFRVEWDPVKSKDQTDPVVGYKVKVWEQKSKTVYEYQMVDGENKLVEHTVLEEFPTDEIPDWEPKEITVEGADKTAWQYDNIKLGLLYEVRVQAYSKKFEGPLSDPMRIKLSDF